MPLGTATHVRDTEYPGVSDEIINLGDFWRSDKLAGFAGEIRSAIDEKRGRYTRVYAYLHAAEQLECELQRIYGGAILHDKMAAAAGRIISGCIGRENKGNGKVIIRPLEAFTAGGVKQFDSFARRAGKRFYIRDGSGTGYRFLRLIIDGALGCGENVEISCDAFSGKRERAVYIPGADVAFVPYEYDEHGYGGEDRIINMERFIDPAMLKPHKNGIRFTRRYRDLLFEGALAELDANKALHARLEQLYGEAMDFSCKENFTKRLLVRIFAQR